MKLYELKVEEEGVDEEKSDEDGRKFLSDQWERYIALRLRLIR